MGKRQFDDNFGGKGKKNKNNNYSRNRQEEQRVERDAKLVTFACSTLCVNLSSAGTLALNIERGINIADRVVGYSKILDGDKKPWTRGSDVAMMTPIVGFRSDFFINAISDAEIENGKLISATVYNGPWIEDGEHQNISPRIPSLDLASPRAMDLSDKFPWILSHMLVIDSNVPFITRWQSDERAIVDGALRMLTEKYFDGRKQKGPALLHERINALRAEFSGNPPAGGGPAYGKFSTRSSDHFKNSGLGFHGFNYYGARPGTGLVMYYKQLVGLWTPEAGNKAQERKVDILVGPAAIKDFDFLLKDGKTNQPITTSTAFALTWDAGGIKAEQNDLRLKPQILKFVADLEEEARTAATRNRAVAEKARFFIPEEC